VTAILFDTDRYNIDAEDQGILQSQAQWLARYPNKRVTIEGHCRRTRHA
jgi:peptidoglycan-associated lipoprotein